MKIRTHYGSLSSSMRTVADINQTKEDIASHVNKAWELLLDRRITPDMVRVEKYWSGVDKRIGWDTHIVIIDGYGPFGFTDGPLIQGEL